MDNKKRLSPKDVIKVLEEKGVEYRVEEIAENFYPWQDVESCMDNTIPVLANHRSCPLCGKPSEELKWIRFMSPEWTWEKLCGVEGDMSICTDCNCQVEFIKGFCS